MALRQRKHPLGSVAAVVEDLKILRETGGLPKADHQVLAATLYARAPLPEHTTEDFDFVCATITEQLEAATKAALERDNGPCSYAAVWSLQILLRGLSPNDKVVIVRRQARVKYDCSLTLDGLRKREDVLIEDIARRVVNRFDQAIKEVQPRSLMEVLLPAKDLIEDAADRLETHLQTLYRFGNPDPDMQDYAIEDSLTVYARLHVFADRLRDVLARSPSEANAFWHMVAARLLNDGIEYLNRVPMLEAGPSWVETRHGFMDELRSKDGWQAVMTEWTEYILSCHQTCGYKRTNVVQLMCEPHQTVLILQEALALITEVERGSTMGEAMRERYGLHL